MSKLKYNDFYKKYVTRDTSRLKSPKVISVSELYLPTGSAIHFVPVTETEIGIDKSNVLMRNIGDRVLIEHVEELSISVGKVNKIPGSIDSMVKGYHRSNLGIHKVRNIEKANKNTSLPLIMNYSLLSRKYTHVKNPLALYQEWFNVRRTIWDNITSLGNDRYHVLQFKMPIFLPSKSEFIKQSKNFTKSGLDNFHTNESLNLLELWRIISEDVVDDSEKVDKSITDMVNLVFNESGNLVIIKLSDLKLWAADNSNDAQYAIYRFWETMLSMRIAIDDDLDNGTIQASSETNGGATDAINTVIAENAAVGNLTVAEQVGLEKLSKKYLKIPNPITGIGTIADMVVVPEDLELPVGNIAQDNITVHDKSILSSSIANMDSLYVEKVLHKDIIQTAMMFQSAGLIVKDVKVKKHSDVASKSETYSVQLQPISGKVSTVSFTVPTIEPDGTFMSGGTRRRLDKQRGD